MKAGFIFILLFIYVSVKGQIFTQNFDSTLNLNAYINFNTTTINQFNGIGPIATGAGPGASIVANNSNKLQLTRSGTTNSFFTRKYMGYNYPQIPAYGALISKVNNAINVKPKVAKNLGVIHLREAFTITIPSSYYEPMYDLGYKIFLNVNYAPSDTGAVEFPDSTTYKNGLANALSISGMKPVLIAVENEEPNQNYHKGYAYQYINELKGAVNIAHSLGFKATNGGITAEVLRYLTRQDYIDRGKTDSATSFFNRTSITLGYNTHYGSASLQERARFCDTLVKAYHDIPIDYVNFHWYGSNRGANSDVLDECINYLERVTGKKSITNEIGQYDTLSSTITDLLAETLQRQLPIVAWYDADGNTALALNTPNGDLRTNGITFRDFLLNNGLAYVSPKFISVSFKINAAGSTTNTTTGNTFMLGNGFGVNTDMEIIDSIHSKISIRLTSDGKFTLGDDAGAFYPAVSGYSSEQAVKWYVNNSGTAQAYIAPNGSIETIANDTWDLWVGIVKAFDDHAAFKPLTALSDFKFLFNQGTATIQLDDINIINEPGIPLPIKLLSFTGAAKDAKILLAWATASEQNNAHFNLLRSVNGDEFKSVATISGNGSQNSVSKYSYTDYSPGRGINYYQLQQVDADGRTEKSQIIAINNVSESSQITVTAIANSSQVQVQYSSAQASQADAAIYDMNGSKIAGRQISLNIGFNTFKMVAEMPAGAYVFTLRNKEISILRKLVIK